MTYLVQQYFSQSAQKYPNKPAVTCDDVVLTYSALEQFSNAFARHIKEAGVGAGTLVPFFMKKSANSVKAFLSILKADAAYVPIDVNSPAQRLESILKACNARVIIVDNASCAQATAWLAHSDIRIINVDAFSGGDTSPLDYKNLSIDLAYVLFTSGSTGVPKGVMIPHQAIIDYIDFCVDTYKITAEDQISNHAPLYFDNSTFDIYTAFKAGATLHLVHEEINAVLPFLVKWLSERKISVFFCVPSVLTMLLKSRRLKTDSFPALRHLLAAGEVLPPAVLAEWMKLYPHVQFTNMYGPTEITVDCTYYTIKTCPQADCTSISIGKARPNMELLIRTESGDIIRNPVAGTEGELLVRGLSVSYGYLGDETRTQQAFIQNPHVSLFKDSLYCTGDLVRVDTEGNYLYLGRMDTQIKYLGYRIELGEIESIIAATEGVEEVVVVFNNSIVEDQKAIAALISLKSDALLASVQTAIKQRLPAYMLPSILKQTTEEFPRTPNGKYDRKQILSQLCE
jgi:D-alanine--poly(phosphoribitol) ligase subunit 1